MKQKYETPNLTLVQIFTEDVLTKSPGNELEPDMKN